MRAVLSTRVVASAVALVLSVLPGVAPAAYMVSTLDRTLTANAAASSFGSPAVDDPKTERSTALGSFDRSFTSTADSPRPNFPGEFAHAGASASQTVTFGASSIEGLLHAAAATGSLAPGETASSEALSSWTSQFTVDMPTPFHITGHMALTAGGLGGQGTSSIVFSFYGIPETEAFVIQNSITPADMPIEASGVLRPGQVYTITVSTGGSRIGDTFQKFMDGNINFTLTLPEPSSAAALLLPAMAAALRRRCHGQGR